MRDKTMQNDDILQKLMTQDPLPEGKGEHSDAAHHLTSLGVPLEKSGTNSFAIDTTSVSIFSGISTLSRMLVNDFIEQCGRGISDIMVQHKLLPQLNPELSATGVEWITVYARLDAAEDLPIRHQEFNDAIELVFHSIQSARWSGLLFPDSRNKKKGAGQNVALLFPFHLYGNRDYFILVEYESSGKFLRITVENARLSRIQLKHVPHRVVDNLDCYHLIPDLRQTARQIYQGILREAFLGKLELNETLEHQPVLFNAIREGGLNKLDTIIFHWPFSELTTLTGEKNADFSAGTDFFKLINKELLILQDRDVLNRLGRDAVIEMRDGAWRVFFELSRRKSCLHVSWQEMRSYAGLADYLDHMPILKKTAETFQDAVPPLHLMLVHHITAEILGFIKACRTVGFSTINTFFVKYSGVVPDDYMETLLSLSEEDYRFHALQRIEKPGSVRGGFKLSSQYSSIDAIQSLDEDLAAYDYSFLDAMRLAAGHVFMRETARIYLNNGKMLLIEDGGYLSPLINQFCLEGKTLADALDYFHVDPAGLGLPKELLQVMLRDWLAPLLVGIVEHTRNGYDANREVEERFGRMQFPVCSIATSDLKRGPEAHECAVSILNAIENVMHRIGLLLSRRRVLVLGSRGAIGSYMLAELVHRLGPEKVAGIDIAVTSGETGALLEVRTLEDLDKSLLYDINFFIGAVGKSIMKHRLLEDLVVHSRQSQLYFASGSTKTSEFIDLENWLVDLQKSGHPIIAGHDIRIEQSPLRDLQTRVGQGQIIELHFLEKDITDKTLYLLANLTPINFLYYGIPREMIDEVLSQLLRVSVGLARHELNERPLPRKLLAVDHEIDSDANLSD